MLARDEDAKGQWRHTQVTRPKWFPSGRTCSACGTVNAKLKREPRWTCPHCGTRHDRNLNAAINLRNLIMPVGRSRNGRGQEVVVLQQRGLQRPRDREPGNGAGTKTDALQMWKRGSPKADHVPKATPQWAK